MKIPAHIIGEKKRREEDRQRRNEGRRVPCDRPGLDTCRERPAERASRKQVVIIQM